MMKTILMSGAALFAVVPSVVSAQYLGKPQVYESCTPKSEYKVVGGTVSGWYATTSTDASSISVDQLKYGAPTTCGPAARYENLTCVNIKTGALAASSVCDMSGATDAYRADHANRVVKSSKVGTQFVNSAIDVAGVNGIPRLPACPAGRYVWKKSQADTSAVCGTQQVSVTQYCVDSTTQSSVDASFCNPAEKSPENSTSVTSYDGCKYDYAVTAWDLPAASCGEATKTRTVNCQRPDGTVVDDGFCQTYFSSTSGEGYGGIYPYDGEGQVYQIDRMPSVCNLGTYSQILGECEATVIYASDDDVYASLRPRESVTFDDARTCGGDDPVEEGNQYIWRKSTFVPEHARMCGSNTRTGSVSCIRKADDVEVSGDFCDEASKPATSETFDDVSGCVPEGVAQCKPSAVTDAQRAAAQSCLSSVGSRGTLQSVVTLGGGGTAYCVSGASVSNQLCSPADWNGGAGISNDSRQPDYVQTVGQGVCGSTVESCERPPEVYNPTQIKVGFCGYTSSGGGRYACGARANYRSSNGPAAPQIGEFCTGRLIAGTVSDDASLDGSYQTPRAGKGWTKAPTLETVQGAKCVIHWRMGYSDDGNTAGWQSAYFDGQAVGSDGLYISKKP